MGWKVFKQIYKPGGLFCWQSNKQTIGPGPNNDKDNLLGNFWRVSEREKEKNKWEYFLFYYCILGLEIFCENKKENQMIILAKSTKNIRPRKTATCLGLELRSSIMCPRTIGKTSPNGRLPIFFFFIADDHEINGTGVRRKSEKKATKALK